MEQLTSGPSESLCAAGTDNVDTDFLGHKHSRLQPRRHKKTHFILKQLWKYRREVGRAKLIMYRVRSLLDGASSFSPYSEVTLSFQSALQMNWALCQWWSSLVKQKSGCEATLLVECPFTILMSQAFIILADCAHTHDCIYGTAYHVSSVHIPRCTVGPNRLRIRLVVLSFCYL